MEKKQRLIYSDSVPMSRICELSDDLLVLILSKLTIKEAARSSVFSHRWEHLWVYYAGSLNFDIVDATFNTRLLLYIGRQRFISWVNHVLNLLRASTFDELRIRLDCDASDGGDDIERWITFAMEKRVSRLELDLSEISGFFPYKLYPFPKKLLVLPTNLLIFFGSLTSLRLSCVGLSDEVLAYLISNCQSLEHLSIKCAGSLTYLNATTALKLKHLEIEYCYLLKNVDISNTNIESLKFHGKWKTHSSLENLYLLREVSLSGKWCFDVVLNGFWPLPISQLQRLELDLGTSVRFREPFSSLRNLKHLVVSLEAKHNHNIFCVTSLIYACPLLSSFTLKVLYVEPLEPFQQYYAFPDCEWTKSDKRVYECLKVVEFIGWYGYKCDFDIVMYLIERSVVLEKVIIDPTLLLPGKRSHSVVEQLEKVSRHRATLLEKNLPPGTELVII